MNRNLRLFKNRASTSRCAFTLIELLVVIAIIAILAAILFPVFAKARERARVATTLSNGKQMIMAITQYVQDYDETLPFTGNGGSLPGNQVGITEWQESIYPYVKSEGAYRCPNDPTEYQKGGLSIAQIAGATNKLSACSFLMNLNVTQGAGNTRESKALPAFDAPADFILLVNGQRPRVSGSNPLRYNGSPDHTGEKISLWQADYFFRPGGVQHLRSYPPGNTTTSTVPHFKDGLAFIFLDGHVKYYPTPEGDPRTSLQARLPWCKHGNIPQGDPGCTTVWNVDDIP
ncbi:MAG: prepilin-type N-terminal cleavage/methylation domain-containing protein [Armatimonadetes bacterium]|nr:prepilin-type N-terminal cleavage/methylation domain-containing protein [Armatimonadota bacterium]